MKDALKSHSKFLSFVLRHGPDAIGLELDTAGWAAVDDLIRLAEAAGRRLTPELIREVVAKNDKQRFVLSRDGNRIRANQGHSIVVDLGLIARRPPEMLYHGTALRFLDSIRGAGLLPLRRQHVHLSSDEPTATSVGRRHGKPVVLLVKALALHDDGQDFYLSDNGVWLTAHVPPAALVFPGG